MEERVDTLVPYGYADVEIATFHAFGDRLLREHALELGLQPDFRVLNRAEQVIFLRDRLFQLPLERYRPLGDPTRHIRALITLISRCKDEDISPEEYAAHADRLAALAQAAPEDEALRERAAQQLELARTYAKYQELMSASGAIDFGDQIVHALRLLRSRPARGERRGPAIRSHQKARRSARARRPRAPAPPLRDRDAGGGRGLAIDRRAGRRRGVEVRRRGHPRPLERGRRPVPALVEPS